MKKQATPKHDLLQRKRKKKKFTSSNWKPESMTCHVNYRENIYPCPPCIYLILKIFWEVDNFLRTY